MHLVTGGAGFIGTHTTRALLDLGEAAVVASRTGRPGPDGAVSVAVDCTDPASLRAVGERFDIDGIVHLAAGSLDPDHPVDVAEADVLALLNVLRAAAEWDVRQLTVASTIGVYGGVPRDSYREDALLVAEPGHLIPALRRTSEALALALSERAVMVRVGAIWGPGGRPVSRFFGAPQLVRASVTGGWPEGVEVPHADDGVDMLYAPDCGRAIAAVHMAPTLRHRVYNIGSGTVTTNREVVDAIGADLGSEPDLPLRPGRGRSEPDAAMDMTRLAADTGFAPRFDLARAVHDFRTFLSAAALAPPTHGVALL